VDSKITAHVQVRKTRSLPDGSECAKGARRQTGDRRPGFIVNYKFQNLDVYKLALDYLDEIYEIVGRLPDSEKFNLSSQIVRAATSVVLNIAEGSTGQSDAEQNRFLGLALRSYLETIACLDIIRRRNYLSRNVIADALTLAHGFFVKLQALRKAMAIPAPRPRSPAREES